MGMSRGYSGWKCPHTSVSVIVCRRVFNHLLTSVAVSRLPFRFPQQTTLCWLLTPSIDPPPSLPILPADYCPSFVNYGIDKRTILNVLVFIVVQKRATSTSTKSDAFALCKKSVSKSVEGRGGGNLLLVSRLLIGCY